MTSEELDAKLTELLGLPAEIEWVEFKEAKNGDSSRNTTRKHGTRGSQSATGLVPHTNPKRERGR
jgi:hypothetical protein